MRMLSVRERRNGRQESGYTPRDTQGGFRFARFFSIFRALDYTCPRTNWYRWPAEAAEHLRREHLLPLRFSVANNVFLSSSSSSSSSSSFNSDFNKTRRKLYVMIFTARRLFLRTLWRRYICIYFVVQRVARDVMELEDARGETNAVKM